MTMKRAKLIETQTGKEHNLTELLVLSPSTEITIGREYGNDIALGREAMRRQTIEVSQFDEEALERLKDVADDPLKAVSRIHAILSYHPQKGYLLTDKSTNGTQISRSDGSLFLKLNNVAPLQHDDEIFFAGYGPNKFVIMD